MTELADLEAVADGGGPWRDGVETARGAADPELLNRLAELLDGPPPGEVLPPMWTTVVAASWPSYTQLGPDGHPVEGVGYPPLPDRRRLFAGGRYQQHAGLRVGAVVERTSRVTKVRAAEGRTGPLLFVTVEQSFADESGAVGAVEEHDLAYRSGPGAGTTGVEKDDGPCAIEVAIDPVALFRFSALTGNSHRIHYDEDYARSVEGLPGRLVHGPLLALLLLESPRRFAAHRTVQSFRFRVSRPVTVGATIGVRHVETADDVWAVYASVDGARCAAGEVVLGKGGP